MTVCPQRASAPSALCFPTSISKDFRKQVEPCNVKFSYIRRGHLLKENDKQDKVCHRGWGTWEQKLLAVSSPCFPRFLLVIEMRAVGFLFLLPCPLLAAAIPCHDELLPVRNHKPKYISSPPPLSSFFSSWLSWLQCLPWQQKGTNAQPKSSPRMNVNNQNYLIVMLLLIEIEM